jgi:hypothetical protein
MSETTKQRDKNNEKIATGTAYYFWFQPGLEAQKV